MAVSTELAPDILVTGEQDYESITRIIDKVILDNKIHNKWFYITLGIGVAGTGLMIAMITWLLYIGVGVWGDQIPVAWAWDIINFVWWIGIGHAGTLISAILLLMRQQWRSAINRFAEAMTIFAVMCAGIYPMLHTGRPWVDYWLFPYPNILALWPQFRSPLFWDVCAVSTYFIVSVLFWYMGLVPDLATMRDRTKNKFLKYGYAIGSLGWRGSAKHWHRYEQSNLILAALATPLVLSVHTTVSYDFAMSIIPGWNETIFPPYFVAGAVFAGFAMVMLFGIPIRARYRLKDLITMKHIDWMCKVMLATGLIVFYGYVMETFMGWYSGNKGEVDLTIYWFIGENKIEYWALLFCNCFMPQFMWFPKLRQNLVVVWIVCVFVNIGMWLERYYIIPMSLQINPLPAIDRPYHPTWVDICLFAGTIGFFTLSMLLFIRTMPAINIFEIKDYIYKVMGPDRIKKAEAAGVE